MAIQLHYDEDGVITSQPIPFLRTPYNYDRDAASNETAIDCSIVPSVTQQQFAEEADINTIVRRFGLTGELPKDVAVPQSGDFLDVTDFHTAMNVVRSSEEAFAAMPADVRKRFANDPAEFMAFVSDDKNRDEARKLGLLVPEAVPPPRAEPTEVRIVQDDPGTPYTPPRAPAQAAGAAAPAPGAYGVYGADMKRPGGA